MRQTEKPERNQALYRDFMAGSSLSQLAEKYGVSINRVSGIIEAMRVKEQLAELRKELAR